MTESYNNWTCVSVGFDKGVVGKFHAASRQQVDEVARKVKGRSYHHLRRQASICRRVGSLCGIFRRSRSEEGRNRGPLTIVGIAILAVMSTIPSFRFGFWAK